MSALGMMRLLPGDVATSILGQNATPEALKGLREKLGLEYSLLYAYYDWVINFVQGNFGTSLVSGLEISTIIPSRLYNTMFLSVAVALISIPLSIVLATVSVVKYDTWIDKSISFFTMSFVALPEFLIGYFLIYVFSVLLDWLPSMAMIEMDMPLYEKIYWFKGGNRNQVE